MNSPKTALPDSMRVSFKTAIQLNAWAAVAVVAAFVSRVILAHGAELGMPERALIALLPLLPAVLYVRRLIQWMRSLDELQRRIQSEAVCFATLGMLLIALTNDLLAKANGALPQGFGWEGYFAITFFLYAFGLARANRRYQ